MAEGSVLVAGDPRVQRAGERADAARAGRRPRWRRRAGRSRSIIVDDGSTDDTPRLLAEAMKRYAVAPRAADGPNGGQSAAFEAGFEAARGQVIATIDADLQNDPEEIPRLLPLLDGYDMVTGWRKDRQDTRLPPLAEPPGQPHPQLDQPGDRQRLGQQPQALQGPRHQGAEAVQRRPPVLPDAGEDARLHRPRGAGQAFRPLRRHGQVRLPQPRPAGVHRPAGGAVDEAAVPAVRGAGSWAKQRGSGRG